MNSTKLKEALAELQSQRNVLDAAIAQLQNVLVLLNGVSDPSATPEIVESNGASAEIPQRSYVDETVMLLERVGMPLHVRDIAEKIGEMRGEKVARASLESSLIRHVTRANKPRIAKLKPSTYGLPAWKNASLFTAPLVVVAPRSEEASDADPS